MSSRTGVAGGERDPLQGPANNLAPGYMVRGRTGHHMVDGGVYGMPHGSPFEDASYMAGTSAVTTPYGGVMRSGAPPENGASMAAVGPPCADARVGTEGLYIPMSSVLHLVGGEPSGSTKMA